MNNIAEELINYIDGRINVIDKSIRDIFTHVYSLKYDKEPDEKLIEKAINNFDGYLEEIDKVFESTDTTIRHLYDEYQCELRRKALLLHIKYKIKILKKQYETNPPN